MVSNHIYILGDVSLWLNVCVLLYFPQLIEAKAEVTFRWYVNYHVTPPYC